MSTSIQESRFCASKSDSLVIQADSSRRQADNVQECFKKLHNMILDIGRSVLPGETSAQQKGRVKRLQKAANESRLRMKKTHSSKKSARSGGGQTGL
ncbi:MAG: hypothetical protein M1836_000086 [Candelina mexicana]|nr:MAG: hypothetical protein M1836_000086 [Candelina mexicana]